MKTTLSRERQRSPFDGMALKRHDGIIHRVGSATNSEASPMGWWVLFLWCNKTAKYNLERARETKPWCNTLVHDPVNCMACIAAGPDTYRYPTVVLRKR